MTSMLRKSSSKAGSRGGDEPSTPEEEQVKVRILASLICVFGPSCEIGGALTQGFCIFCHRRFGGILVGGVFVFESLKSYRIDV